jgi:hypothetical protein
MVWSRIDDQIPLDPRFVEATTLLEEARRAMRTRGRCSADSEPRRFTTIASTTTSGVIRLARTGELPELRDSGGRRVFRRTDVEQLARARRERKFAGNGGATRGLHDACQQQAAVNRVRNGGVWERPTQPPQPKGRRK